MGTKLNKYTYMGTKLKERQWHLQGTLPRVTSRIWHVAKNFFQKKFKKKIKKIKKSKDWHVAR